MAPSPSRVRSLQASCSGFFMMMMGRAADCLLFATRQRVVYRLEDQTPLVFRLAGSQWHAGAISGRCHLSTSSSFCPSSGFSFSIATIKCSELLMKRHMNR
jgi:hypothetical protein